MTYLLVVLTTRFARELDPLPTIGSGTPRRKGVLLSAPPCVCISIDTRYSHFPATLAWRSIFTPHPRPPTRSASRYALIWCISLLRAYATRSTGPYERVSRSVIELGSNLFPSHPTLSRLEEELSVTSSVREGCITCKLSKPALEINRDLTVGQRNMHAWSVRLPFFNAFPSEKLRRDMSTGCWCGRRWLGGFMVVKVQKGYPA